MFPDQNIHYNKNYNVGYQGVNYIKATEYNNRFKYDSGKARIALEGNVSRQKRRMTTIQEPSGYDLRPQKIEPPPMYAASLPSQDNRQVPYYPESLPPMDEAPPSSGLDRKMDQQQLIIDDQIRSKEEENLREQMAMQPPRREELQREDLPREMSDKIQGPPLVAYNPQPDLPRKAKEDQWDLMVKEQVKAAETERANLEARKKANTLTYKEELDRQMQYKKQRKVEAVGVKAREMQMAKEWQEEQERVNKNKQDDARKVQEATRDYYERQINEKGSSVVHKAHSRSNIPPIGQIRDQVVEEKKGLMENKRRAIEEMDRLERDKNRIKQEIMSRDQAGPEKVPVDSPGFVQDVDRMRFKQVCCLL